MRKTQEDQPGWAFRGTRGVSPARWGLSRLEPPCWPPRPHPITDAGNCWECSKLKSESWQWRLCSWKRSLKCPSSDCFSDDYTPWVEQLFFHCRVTISMFLLNFNRFSNCALCVSPSSLSVSVKRPGLSLELHKNTTEKDPGAGERHGRTDGTGDQVNSTVLDHSLKWSSLRPSPFYHLRSLAFLSWPLILPTLYDSAPWALSVQSFHISSERILPVSSLPVSRENNLLSKL